MVQFSHDPHQTVPNLWVVASRDQVQGVQFQNAQSPPPAPTDRSRQPFEGLCECVASGADQKGGGTSNQMKKVSGSAAISSKQVGDIM